LHAACRRTAREFARQHGPNPAIAIRSTQELEVRGTTGAAESATRILNPGLHLTSVLITSSLGSVISSTL